MRQLNGRKEILFNASNIDLWDAVVNKIIVLTWSTHNGLMKKIANVK